MIARTGLSRAIGRIACFREANHVLQETKWSMQQKVDGSSVYLLAERFLGLALISCAKYH